MPELTLGAAYSTDASSESMLDSTRFTESAALHSTSAAEPKKKRNPGERIQRSRERNRIHARKTRQRKKEQLQSLQTKAEQLKGEQTKLKLSINEKQIANILTSKFESQSSSAADPMVEALLTRPDEEIPDPSNLPALQPLILPSGAQHSKRGNSNVNSSLELQELPNDGIDYELLGKDRSKCSPAELDQIRRERNRMHAKRTRDRKRLFMEEMAEMCKALDGENLILQQHLNELNGIKTKPETVLSATASEATQPQNFMSYVALVSPSLSPTIAPTGYHKNSSHGESALPLTIQNGASFDQMKTLLDAAGVFDLNNTDMHGNSNSITNAITISAVSVSSEDPTDISTRPLKKRRQFHPSSTPSSDEDGAE